MSTDSEKISQMLSATVDYTKRGWVCHPLSKPTGNHKSAGKQALLPEWSSLAQTPDETFAKLKTGCNLGLVTGKNSGVTVFDFDTELFYRSIFPGGAKTLESQRTPGRRHAFFKYALDAVLPSQKDVEFLKIEVQNTGMNIVLPPSTHKSGDVYHWIDPAVPIRELTEEEIKRTNDFFKLSTDLKCKLHECGACFDAVVRAKPNMNSGEDRSALLGLFAELKIHEATEDELLFCAKLIFREKFDKKETTNSLKYVKAEVPHKCETLRNDFKKYILFDGLCDNCTRYKRQPKSKKPKIESAVDHPFLQTGKKPQEHEFIVIDYKKMENGLGFPGIMKKGIDDRLSTPDEGWYKKAIKAGAIKAPEKPGTGIKRITIVHGSLNEDPAVVKIEVEIGGALATISLKESEISNYKRFRQKCFIACKTWLPPMSDREWELYMGEQIQDADDIVANQDDVPVVTDILNYISQAKVVKDREELLKNNGRTVWENDGCIWVPSKIIELVAKERDINLRRTRDILSTYLKGDAKQWRIKNGRVSLWPFDKGKIDKTYASDGER